MLFAVLVIFISNAVIVISNNKQESELKSEKPDLIVELTDEKWDQMQKGQWLIGFFDKESDESRRLEEDWPVFALKCKKFNINTARVFAPHNPGLYVRFLVTVFPKVFYVKNGVAHEVPKVSREALIKVIIDQKWSELKPVNFLSNPFSVQMSLLSHLFVHAVNLYNFEHSIVQKFVSAPSATDVVFGLTFIIVGTFLGLLMTCAFGILQIFFMESKEPEDTTEDKIESDDEEDTKENDSSDNSSSVRKRK